MRLYAFFLLTISAIAQPPPITINQTQVQGGIAADCLKVNSNRTLGQGTCGGGGGSPANPNTSVQFNNSGSFGGSSKFTWDGNLVLDGNEAVLPPLLQGYETPTNLLVAGDAGGNALAVFETFGSFGIYSVVQSKNSATATAVEGDAYAGADTGNAIGVTGFASANGFAAGSLYGFVASSPSLGGGSATVAYGLFVQSQVGGSPADAYPLWTDNPGVYVIHSINTFNSVYQDRPALYNPQFTQYSPGAANYERIVEQWESNVAVITTEKGGTGTLRDMQLGDAGVHILVTDLKTTGSATGKTVVCVDVSTGRLYASTSGVACAN